MAPLTPQAVGGLGPADVGVARRVRPPEVTLNPPGHFTLSRDATMPFHHQTGEISPHGIDPHRDGEEYTAGKPFPWPGIGLAFVSSPRQWQDEPPLGYIPRLFQPAPQIGAPRGRQLSDGDQANIQVPPAYAYGSLFATYSAPPYA